MKDPRASDGSRSRTDSCRARRCRRSSSNARRYGFEAIELSQQPFEDARDRAARAHPDLRRSAAAIAVGSSIPIRRRSALARKDLARLVALAGELGTGCVVVPIWGRTRHLPNIGTGRARDADELIFVEGMRALASRAERAGAQASIVEPINRYQNDLCVTIADALRLRDRIGSPAVFVMGDVFHMNIEEADLGARARVGGGVARVRPSRGFAAPRARRGTHRLRRTSSPRWRDSSTTATRRSSSRRSPATPTPCCPRRCSTCDRRSPKRASV